MAIFRPVGVDIEPEVVMSQWSVYSVKSGVDGVKNTTHIVGTVNGIGRVCSPVQSFDKETRTAITRSGRKYFLDGEPGKSNRGMYVFAHWREMLGNPEIKEITDEYVS